MSTSCNDGVPTGAQLPSGFCGNSPCGLIVPVKVPLACANSPVPPMISEFSWSVTLNRQFCGLSFGDRKPTVVLTKLNPQNCLFSVTLQENSEIIGGTGLFAHASGTFTGTISPQGLLPQNPDGSCAPVGTPSLHEVDMVAFSGTLSF